MTLSIITLDIDPLQVFSFAVLVVNILAFIVMYRKYVKTTVNQEDLKDLKDYVDQQDRSLHHRINDQKADWTKAIDRIEKSNSDMHKFLLNHFKNKGK